MSDDFGAQLLVGTDPKAPQCVDESPYQRLRITVPRVETMLYMGAPASGGTQRFDDIDSENAPGFGVLTKGHVFIDAHESAEESQMRLQSAGSMSIQTASNLAIGGQGGTLMASKAGVNVVGEAGVLIHGGGKLPWTELQTSSAKGPDAPSWLGAIDDAATKTGNYLAGIDAAVGLVSLGLATWDAVKGWPTWTRSIATAVSALGTLAGTTASASSAVLGAECFQTPGVVKTWGGTTIVGDSGLVMASGLTAGLYSLAGTTLASPASVSLMAGASVSMVTLGDCAMSGWHTTLQGKKTLSLAGDDVSISASAKGLGLYGVKLWLGHNPASTGPGGAAPTADQRLTSHVAVGANSEVKVVSDNYILMEANGDLGMTVKVPRSSLLQQVRRDFTEATEALDHRVSDWKLRITPSGAQIGKAIKADCSSEVKKEKNSGAIFTDSEVVIGCQKFGSRYTSSRAAIGNKDDFLVATSGKVQVKSGGKILLG